MHFSRQSIVDKQETYLGTALSAIVLVRLICRLVLANSLAEFLTIPASWLGSLALATDALLAIGTLPYVSAT